MRGLLSEYVNGPKRDLRAALIDLRDALELKDIVKDIGDDADFIHQLTVAVKTMQATADDGDDGGYGPRGRRGSFGGNVVESATGHTSAAWSLSHSQAAVRQQAELEAEQKLQRALAGGADPDAERRGRAEGRELARLAGY